MIKPLDLWHIMAIYIIGMMIMINHWIFGYTISIQTQLWLCARK